MNRCLGKIAFLLSCVKFGGAERVALNLAHALRGRGFSIDIVLMVNEGEFLQEAQLNFNVVDLACNKTYKLPAKFLKYVLEEKPTFVISSFWKLNFCACMVRAFWPSFGLALWEHSSPYQTKSTDRLYYFVVSNTLYHIANHIVAVSRGVGDLIKQNSLALKGKVVCLPNPIPGPEPILLTVARARHERWVKGNNTNIVYVGRLAPEKNPLLLLRAFIRVPDLIKKNMTLTFVGDGPLRSELEQMILDLHLCERVKCTGFQIAPYEIIARSDILVLPSNREGLPSVLIEALYCGCSIVATDCGGGVRDILQDGRFGTLVPVGDEEALAEGILTEAEMKRCFEHQVTGTARFSPDAVARLFQDTIFK
ncbi:N-acetylgalactosamine-N, N'-diacetylbacillosaminyl-diphospho-undecaprenol 4-alpha-N-acetylgalactosaminyltransferase [freshwater sediment metagenome]|uniref:N-acetylgalactosamine-N, N'-diacetylbacillosaminyl-diphospho-undecaprenol 4-alpha-N-acetylgalactosaminyltransferase n=1 Tax=freshwater sediment metagenome TaxID=556182 RepID=A0AA48M617_9ZZZZ